MTQLGRLQREFYDFREEVLKRLETLEEAKSIEPSEKTRKVSKSKSKVKEAIVLETSNDEIVGTDFVFEE